MTLLHIASLFWTCQRVDIDPTPSSETPAVLSFIFGRPEVWVSSLLTRLQAITISKTSILMASYAAYLKESSQKDPKGHIISICAHMRVKLKVCERIALSKIDPNSDWFGDWRGFRWIESAAPFRFKPSLLILIVFLVRTPLDLTSSIRWLSPVFNLSAATGPQRPWNTICHSQWEISWSLISS